MKKINPEWYKYWTLDMKNQTWVEDTENQVDFKIKKLKLTGKERVLDLACGFGRHSLSLARKGFSVVGIDITQEYIDDAIREAKSASLAVEFILSDIRDIKYNNEFDVVLNLADGACNAEHAEHYFPKRYWDIGTTTLSLPIFDWDKENHRMLFSDWEIKFGEVAQKPASIEPFSSTRLYSKSELDTILKLRQMEVISTFSDYYGKEASNKEMQLLVYSQKDK